MLLYTVWPSLKTVIFNSTLQKRPKKQFSFGAQKRTFFTVQHESFVSFHENYIFLVGFIHTITFTSLKTRFTEKLYSNGATIYYIFLVMDIFVTQKGSFQKELL